MKGFYLLTLFATFCVNYRAVSACGNGVTIKNTKIENCGGPDGVITLAEDTILSVTDDCSLVAQGCLKVKAFTTASGVLRVTKNGRALVNKNFNLCEATGKLSFINKFLPGGVCPQKDNEFCIDPKMKLPLKQFLAFLKGSIEIEVVLEHDTGKTCIKLQAEISK